MSLHEFKIHPEEERLITTLSDIPVHQHRSSACADLWTGERFVELFPSEDPILIELRNIPLQCRAAVEGHPVSSETDSLNQFIAKGMSDLTQVERVYSKFDGQVFYTWIVIEQRDREVQKAVYEREQKIINRFPEYGFDFYVVYRSGADIDSLVSGEIELVYSK